MITYLVLHAIAHHLYKENVIGVTNIILAPCLLHRCITIVRRQEVAPRMVNIMNRFGMPCVAILACMHFHTKKTKGHQTACMHEMSPSY
jgi:hypothetical protein